MSISIPGIGDDDDVSDKSSNIFGDAPPTQQPDVFAKPEIKMIYRVVVDSRIGSIAIISLPPGEKFDETRYVLIQEISEEQVKRYGKKVEDDDYDEDTDIHCDKCDHFYRPFCLEHPLFIIPDRNVNQQPGEVISLVPAGKACNDFERDTEEDGQPKTRATRSCPPLFKIKKSRIPNAGLGVFSRMLIPAGFVFGPYVGLRRENKASIDVDGYAWEILDGNQKFYIDGGDPEYSNWLRYINSPRNEEEQNLIAFQLNGKVFYRVIKPIKCDKELLVWYGSSFGHSLVHKCYKATGKRYKNPYIM